MSTSLQNCNQVYDNCCIFSSKPPTCLITHIFAPLKLLMKGADGLFCIWCQLHWVLCQIIYTSFPPNATLWSTLVCNTCHRLAVCKHVPLLRLQLKQMSKQWSNYGLLFKSWGPKINQIWKCCVHVFLCKAAFPINTIIFYPTLQKLEILPSIFV